MSPSSTRHFAAERLKESQAQSGLTNDKLAERLDIAPRLLGKWRAGTVAPSGGNLIALADVLGVHPSFFYVAAASPDPQEREQAA